MHRLLPSGAEFLARAPAHSVTERDLRVSAARLFETLEDPRAWVDFFPVIRTVEWTSPSLLREGATRVVTLIGGIRLEEVFWTWEPGRRMGFAITAASSGALRALVETYDITPLDEGRCRLRWEMGLELSGPTHRVERSVARFLPGAQTWLLKRLERVARRHASS